MINGMGHVGIFEIVTRDTKSGKMKREALKNRIMDVDLNTLAAVLAGTAPDLEIKYLALGTGNTAITDTDTTLATEIFRTPPVDGPTLTTLGRVETEFVVLDTEAVGLIQEIGIFAGSAATGTADTGKLIARILWTKNKTSSEEITIKRIDTIFRG